MSFSVACPVCEKTFTSVANLDRHRGVTCGDDMLRLRRQLDARAAARRLDESDAATARAELEHAVAAAAVVNRKSALNLLTFLRVKMHLKAPAIAHVKSHVKRSMEAVQDIAIKLMGARARIGDLSVEEAGAMMRR